MEDYKTNNPPVLGKSYKNQKQLSFDKFCPIREKSAVIFWHLGGICPNKLTKKYPAQKYRAGFVQDGEMRDFWENAQKNGKIFR